MNEILERIQQSSHITVIAHVNPDADSLGGASAMYTHILRLHKKVSFFCASTNLNQKLSFLPWFDKIRSSFPPSSDLAISFDCASQERLGIDLERDLINVDHHKSNIHFGKFSLIDANCISTTEVLYNFFTQNGIEINKKMATALYAGLLEDSNGFMSNKVDGTTFALGSKLIAQGADYRVCHQFIMHYLTLGAFRLKGLMQTNMELLNDGRIAIFCVSNEDMKRTGAIGTDCEYALEEALYLPTVEISLLLLQNYDLSIKGSLRSKNRLDVSAIASQLGGGGHLNRAGFNIKNGVSLESTKIEMLKLIHKDM